MKKLPEERQSAFRRYIGFIIAIPLIAYAILYLLRHVPSKDLTLISKQTSPVVIIQNDPPLQPTPRQVTPVPTTPVPGERVITVIPAEDDKKPVTEAPKPPPAPLS